MLSNSNLMGNEKADRLAEAESEKQQMNRPSHVITLKRFSETTQEKTG